MKPQQRTPFDAPFMVLLWALTFVVVEGLAVQVGGQVASWVFGGHRPVFGAIGTGTVVFGRLVHHLGDPELAWSPADRPSLPGPVAMWASLLVTQLVLVGLVVVTVRLVRRLRGIGQHDTAVRREPVVPTSSGAWVASPSIATPPPSTGRTRSAGANHWPSGSTSPPAPGCSPSPRTTSSPSACPGSARARGS